MPPMLTPEDKKWLEESFATKKELGNMRDSIDLLRQKMANSFLEKFDFKTRIESLEATTFRTEEKVDKLITMVDGFGGKVADLEQENKMGAVTLHRHGVNIRELAEATKTKISD